MRKWDVYFITDSGLTRSSVLEDAEAAVEAGCRVVQYREKSLPAGEMLREARGIKKLCAGRADFIVDDRLDICLAVDADGIHVGEDDLPVDTLRGFLPGKIIGYTVHSFQEAVEAQKLDVDYISLGHIFRTTTKQHTTKPLGLEVLKQVRDSVSVPLVAIGGINAGNLASVIEAGADSAAIVSGIVASKDVYSEAKKLRGIVNLVKEKNAVVVGQKV